MMLLNKNLKISLVTRHIPLMDLADKLKTNEIYKVALITNNYLRSLFSIKTPKLVICGVNPHASDNGLLGRQENSIILPAVKKIKQAGLKIEGPLPADIAIYKAAQRYYDAVIAMYHDQALIALRLTGPNSGVNLTLGLPFIRTSPLHGTAFDIAGKNIASPDSLIAAIKLAIRCTLNQRKV
jgi:4-hydroxythreonine-4-phosphate dehydrogenase